jgi:hypothetical protein
MPSYHMGLHMERELCPACARLRADRPLEEKIA